MARHTSKPPHFKTRLKSAKNLYLSHRFFCKIRQIHRIFDDFRQNLQILCRNKASSRHPSGTRFPPLTPRPPGEKPRPLAALSHKKPGIHTKWIPGRNHFLPVRAARSRPAVLRVVAACLYRRTPRARTPRTCLTCTRRSPYQQQRRSRPCQSSL